MLNALLMGKSRELINRRRADNSCDIEVLIDNEARASCSTPVQTKV